MFWAMFLLIIRSTWLYLQVVFAHVAAGWCLERVETELCGLWGVYWSIGIVMSWRYQLINTRLTSHIVQFQLIQDTSRQLLGRILPDTVISQVLLMMGENIAWNM